MQLMNDRLAVESSAERTKPAAKSALRPGTQNWESRFHLSMAAVTCGVVAISLVGYFFCRLTLDPWAALPILIILLGVAAAAAQYRWRGEHKCFNVVMLVFWVVLVTNCHYFPMYMAARCNVPMNDALLANCDRAMGVDVPTVRAALAPYPRLNYFLLEIYKTLIPLMTVATLLPPLVNRIDKSKEFVVGCIIAATISLPIFACLQAVGPWEYYGFPPAFESLSQKDEMLATLKTDQVFVIDVTNRDGLITFPSFHVVLTALAAAALWPLRWVRWPAALWATLIVVSTVTTGIHYTIDVVGGLGLAVVAHAGARVYIRKEQSAWAWLFGPKQFGVRLAPAETFASDSLVAK